LTLMGRALLLRARRLDFRSPAGPPGSPRTLLRDVKEMVPVMREAQEIDDEEHEQILERVCAVDVAKASGMVCTRVPHPSRPGARRTRVREVDATTNAILELGEQLAGEGIEKVTLESTSDYWRIWFYLLEAAGLEVQLVNARDVKNAPGRPKTDKLTELWRGSGSSGRQVLIGASTLAGHGRRRGRGAESVPVGGWSAWVAGAHWGSFRAVSVR